MHFGPGLRAGVEDQQTNRLAAVAEGQHEQTRAAVFAAVRVADHGAGAVIDLGFFADCGLNHGASLFGRAAGQLAHEALDTLIVYANTITKTADDGNGQDVEREIPFLKGYTVFNVEQIEGLPEIYYTRPDPKHTGPERITHAEAFFAKTGADIRTRGSRAYYAVDADFIAMPPIESFRDAESFYATIAHESTHWTKHPSRLERDFGRKAWGDEGYAREELVAELGAAFLCCDLGLTPEVRDDHASYIATWLEVLKNDKRAIFQAASYAQRAVAYLHQLQEPKEAAA